MLHPFKPFTISMLIKIKKITPYGVIFILLFALAEHSFLLTLVYYHTPLEEDL